MIRIGVTGHRFLADVEKLKEGIDQVLSRIEQNNPGQDWAVISALAEGADRLVVERIWAAQPAAKLIIPLPLPVEEYLKDFAGEASRQEFLDWLGLAVEVSQPARSSAREDGYQAAGLYVLEHSDYLVALWDGRPTQGKGGTGETVQLAREKRLPIGWVVCGNRKPGTNELVSLGDRQGTVRFENF